MQRSRALTGKLVIDSPLLPGACQCHISTRRRCSYLYPNRLGLPKSNMIKSTVDAVGASMRNSKQKDDDCVSEDSFGSDFDNAVAIDEGDSGLKARLNGVDTELNSPPPVYSEGEHFQSTSLLANMDVKSPCIVLQYTSPTGPTELEPAFDVSPNLSGPSMCVVRGLIFNLTLISINLYNRSARFHLPIVKMEFPIRPAGHLSVLPKFLLP